MAWYCIAAAAGENWLSCLAPSSHSRFYTPYHALSSYYSNHFSHVYIAHKANSQI